MKEWNQNMIERYMNVQNHLFVSCDFNCPIHGKETYIESQQEFSTFPIYYQSDPNKDIAGLVGWYLFAEPSTSYSW